MTLLLAREACDFTLDMFSRGVVHTGMLLSVDTNLRCLLLCLTLSFTG